MSNTKPSVLSSKKQYDIVIVGGGNAALCAALASVRVSVQASVQGGGRKKASVLIVESAPKHMRGGNTRHTRNLRLAHDKPTEFLSERYGVDEYMEDLLKVTKGDTNSELAQLLLEQSLTISEWMNQQGARFQPCLSGTLSLGRTNAFFLGGGKTLLNGYYVMAQKLGVDICYETEVIDLAINNGKCSSVTIRHGQQDVEIACGAVVVASGGYQSNPEWLKQDWGEAADNLLIRGTPHNRGIPLKILLDAGCAKVGHPGQAHMVAIDGRSPKYDGGIATRLDCVPFSVVVNKQCERFYDEGEDFWPKRYAIWGRLVAKQPDQIAYAIIDAKSADLFMPSVFKPYQADSIESLGTTLGLDPSALAKTISEFNQACSNENFDPARLDGRHTNGLEPNKTNWARPLDQAPFFGYVLKPGVTFTYLGVKVDRDARVVMDDGNTCDNLFAAGEIMAGNILGQGYLAGTGMTIGSVFGRIAGEQAAKVIAA